MDWIQGGPFLEVSFILEERESIKSSVTDIIARLNLLKFEIVIVNNNLDNLINEYEEGYRFDENEQSSSLLIHSMRLNLIVKMNRERKAILFIDRIAEQTIKISFAFYGDMIDAKEWEQIGIQHEEMYEFEEFLIDLFKVYRFIIGGIAFEEDVIGFYNSSEQWPSDDYKFTRINFKYILNNPSYFYTILLNGDYEKVNKTQYKEKIINNNSLLVFPKESN